MHTLVLSAADSSRHKLIHDAAPIDAAELLHGLDHELIRRQTHTGNRNAHDLRDKGQRPTEGLDVSLVLSDLLQYLHVDRGVWAKQLDENGTTHEPQANR